MKDFRTLEEEHRRTPVTLDLPKVVSTGVLSLAGIKTEVHLQIPRQFNINADENGWFDLGLKATNGKSIFLHNALCRTKSFGFGNRDENEVKIFPNFVAFGAEHLSKGGKITEIRFTIGGLRDFFYYEAIEWQSLHKVTTDIKVTLRKIRKLEKKYPRNYEFFNPRELWLIHDMPRVLEFMIDDRKYNIYMGFHGIHSLTSPSITVFPIATIKFCEPVSIDDGVNYAWDWRRYFSQLAMEQLPFESISVRGKYRPYGYADLYLPHLDEKPSTNQLHRFYPGLAPFNQWKERHLLAQSMKGWLEKSPDRRIFRANLERVIVNMSECSTPDHVLSLAAGIESLTELDSSSQYSKKDIKVLVDGAITAANSKNIKIESERLNGLLSMLRKQNLQRRLKLINKTITPLLPQNPDEILNPVQKIRNANAHGSAGIDRLMSKVSTTTHALAAICAIWDQKTSGLNFERLENRLNSQKIAAESLQYLMRKD